MTITWEQYFNFIHADMHGDFAHGQRHDLQFEVRIGTFASGQRTIQYRKVTYLEPLDGLASLLDEE